MATNYAQIDFRTAFLNTEFGEEIARKWFGNETIDSLPRYTRGPHKGKPKGAVTWSKVVRGGWVRGDRENFGYVEKRVGRVFERKLHQIESSRFGVHVGDVIRDLDAEERKAEQDRLRRACVDEEIRKFDMRRALLEQCILNDAADGSNKSFQNMIAEYNEDIAVLCDDLKTKKEPGN